MYIPHNDLPQTDCLLERNIWVEKIAIQIMMSEPPKTIAIHGTWGTGKTSALAQLDKKISGNSIYNKSSETTEELKIDNLKIQTVWFEAWQYQREENIVAALLKEIREQLTLPQKIWSRVKEDAAIGTLSMLQSIEFEMGAFGMSLGVKNLGDKIDNNVNALQKEKFSQPLPSHTLKKLLEESITRLLKITSLKKDQNLNHKLIVFIDDLDRCEPDVAFKVLEAIKVYLNLNNCIFVLGMDQDAIELIIARHYEKQLPSIRKSEYGIAEEGRELKQLARLYLEKICQDIYHLPVLTPQLKVNFFEQLLLVEEQNKYNILSILSEYDILPPIPRSIKIYANILMLFLNSQPKNKIKLGKLIAVLILSYLYSFHYEIYQLTYLYSGFYNDEFFRFCKDGQTDNEVLKLIQLPELSAQDEIQGSSNATLTNQIKYPLKNLRHVLWIRELVVAQGPIDETLLNELKV